MKKLYIYLIFIALSLMLSTRVYAANPPTLSIVGGGTDFYNISTLHIVNNQPNPPDNVATYIGVNGTILSQVCLEGSGNQHMEFITYNELMAQDGPGQADPVCNGNEWDTPYHLINNGTYKFFVQTYNNTDGGSDWSEFDFTFHDTTPTPTSTPMPTPTITPTPTPGGQYIPPTQGITDRVSYLWTVEEKEASLAPCGGYHDCFNFFYFNVANYAIGWNVVSMSVLVPGSILITTNLNLPPDGFVLHTNGNISYHTAAKQVTSISFLLQSIDTGEYATISGYHDTSTSSGKPKPGTSDTIISCELLHFTVPVIDWDFYFPNWFCQLQQWLQSLTDINSVFDYLVHLIVPTQLQIQTQIVELEVATSDRFPFGIINAFRDLDLHFQDINVLPEGDQPTEIPPFDLSYNNAFTFNGNTASLPATIVHVPSTTFVPIMPFVLLVRAIFTMAIAGWFVIKMIYMIVSFIGKG